MSEDEWRYSVEDVDNIDTEPASSFKRKLELLTAIFFTLLTLWIIFAVIQNGMGSGYEQFGMYMFV